MFFFCSMTGPDPIAERTQQLLGELAELSMSLARDLHACALAAESVEEKAQMAAAFHKAARSVRQSLALHARMRRDERREAAEALAAAEAAKKARVRARRERLFEAVDRLIWDEAEDDDSAARRSDEAAERLDALAEAPDFLETPAEVLIARLCAAFGITPPATLSPAWPDATPSSNSS